MIKLMIVTPNEPLYVNACAIVKNAGLEATVIRATSETVVAQVRSAMSDATGVVVARGNHAHLIKTQTDYPVVDVVLSGQELAMLLARAADMVSHRMPRVGLVGFRYMFSNPEPIAQLIPAAVDVYYARSSRELSTAVEKAKQDGKEIIIGGEIACAAAERMGMMSLFMDTMHESLQSAIRLGVHILEAIRIENARTTEFQKLLSSCFDAILRLDESGHIVLVNDMACKLLHRSADTLEGTHFLSMSGLMAAEQLSQAMEARRNLYSTVIRIDNDSFVVRMTCLTEDNTTLGFIVTMQAFEVIDDLEDTIRSTRQQHQHRAAKADFSTLQTRSPLRQAMLEDARQYAQYNVPLLLKAPPGAQHLQLAEAIHNASLRRNYSFIVANPAEISEEMQSRVLFGSDKEWQAQGLVNIDHKGTLYIQEVGYLSEENQRQLLSLLLHGEYRRESRSMPIPAPARILCHTSLDLAQREREGRFLPRLREVLEQLMLALPPLRDCPEDVPALLEAALGQFSAQYKKYPRFSEEATALLLHYSWPGNEEELYALCRRAVLLARENSISAEFVQARLLPHRPAPEPDAPERPLMILLDPEEKRLREAYAACNGDRAAMQAMLGVSRSTLWRRMKKYELR